MSRHRPHQRTNTYRIAAGPLVPEAYDVVDTKVDSGEPTLPAEMEDEAAIVYVQIFDDPAASLPTLLAWLDRYPDVPTVKNWLQVAYRGVGRAADAAAIADRVVAEHPDYLFARLHRVEQLLADARYDEIPAALGGLDLKQIYPHRSTFHVSEAIGLWGLLAKYKLMVGDLLGADRHWVDLQRIAPDHPMTAQVGGLFGRLVEAAQELLPPPPAGGSPPRPPRQGSHTPKKDRNRRGRRR